MKSLIFTMTMMLFASVLFAQESEYSFKEQYEIAAASPMTFDVVDSDIKVLASDVNQVSIFYTVRRNNELLKMNRNELEEYFTIDIDNDANGLKIKVRSKKKNQVTNWKDRINIDFAVIAPETALVNLFAVDGDLAIKGFNSDQKYNTVDGDIKFTEISGYVNAKTADGDISATKIKGKMEVKTTDGDIKVKEVAAFVNAKTVDGDISFYNLSGGIVCNAVDGDINGQFTVIEGSCECHTVDGDIHLLLPVSAGFNLEMKGEDVKIPLKNFDGDVVSDDYIKGKVNGGGEFIKLATNDGDMKLEFE